MATCRYEINIYKLHNRKERERTGKTKKHVKTIRIKIQRIVLNQLISQIRDMNQK